MNIKYLDFEIMYGEIKNEKFWLLKMFTKIINLYLEMRVML